MPHKLDMYMVRHRGSARRTPLDIVIYRVIWSQGTQDGLTVIEESARRTTQKNQAPQIQALSRSLGHSAIVHVSSRVLREKRD